MQAHCVARTSIELHFQRKPRLIDTDWYTSCCHYLPLKKTTTGIYLRIIQTDLYATVAVWLFAIKFLNAKDENVSML